MAKKKMKPTETVGSTTRATPAVPAKGRGKGKKPTTTGRALAVTRGKGKKKGLKRQGY